MKVQWRVSAAALAMILALSGCSAKEEVAQQESLTAVETKTAAAGEIENAYTYSGKVAPKETAMVYSLVSGIVDEVYVEVGDRVEAGDPLFQMDTESIQNSLGQLQASYEAALANVKVAQTSLESVDGAQTQMQLQQLETALASAEMARDQAKTSYENTKVLYEQGFVSQTDMDAAEDAYQNAENAYQQAKTSYDLTSGDLLEENRTKAQASVEAAQANANALQAQMASAQKSLKDAHVTSPISGVVTEKNVTAGTLLSSSSTPIVVEDTSVMKVAVGVSEETVNRISLGMPVDVKINASEVSDVTGSITLISPSANAMGMYDVEISLDNAAGDIKTGMFAEVHLSKEQGEDAIVLERDAVISKNGEEYVFVVEDGKAVKKNVTLGIDSGTQVQVLTGLTEGEQVIVSGQTYVEDQEDVRVVKQDGVQLTTTPTAPAEESDQTDAAGEAKGE